MAKVIITTWQNDDALYDYNVNINGRDVESGENYTTEDYAIIDAQYAYRIWRNNQ